MTTVAAPNCPTADDTPLPGVLGSHRWLVYVLPYLVFLLVTSLEPAPPADASADSPAAASTGEDAATEETADGQPPVVESAASGNSWLHLPYRYYPVVYTAKIVATIAAMALVWAGYRRYPFRISPLSVAVGILGIVVWVVLAQLQREWSPQLGLKWLGGSATRSAYNPLEQLAGTPWAVAFLAVRFLGLALVVPMIEEFFLRGFVLRYFTHPDWWKVPFGTWHTTGIAVMTLAAVATHPAELLAAIAWFSLVTWLMLRTKNIWDCVAAHAVTNLLLGVYVVATNNWHLM